MKLQIRLDVDLASVLQNREDPITKIILGAADSIDEEGILTLFTLTQPSVYRYSSEATIIEYDPALNIFNVPFPDGSGGSDNVSELQILPSSCILGGLIAPRLSSTESYEALLPSRSQLAEIIPELPTDIVQWTAYSWEGFIARQSQAAVLAAWSLTWDITDQDEINSMIAEINHEATPIIVPESIPRIAELYTGSKEDFVRRYGEVLLRGWN